MDGVPEGCDRIATVVERLASRWPVLPAGLSTRTATPHRNGLISRLVRRFDVLVEALQLKSFWWPKSVLDEIED